MSSIFPASPQSSALQIIAPLIGVLLGGILSVYGQRYRSKQERRRTIGLALSDLLEIRHQLVTVDVIVRHMRNHVEIPPASLPMIRNAVDTVIGKNGGLDERYNNAISLLAGLDPVLAFSLRSKNAVPHLLSTMRNVGIDSGADLSSLEMLESSIRAMALPKLNDAILTLARHHSYSTEKAVNKILDKEEAIDPELTTFFENIKSTTAQSMHTNEAVGAHSADG